MKNVLSQPLGQIPLALASPERTLRKTNKAVFAKRFKKYSDVVENLRDHSSIVIHEMALVQLLEADNTSFCDGSKSVFSKTLNEGSSGGRIDIVFDV